MPCFSYDPRETVRGIICDNKYLNPDVWESQSVVTLTHQGLEYNIPVYLLEESRSKDLPPLPLIELKLMKVDYIPNDVGARWRKMEAYVDIGVYYCQSDEIDSATFGKAIVDELICRIRAYQEECAFSPSSFVNVRSVRQIELDNGRQVVYQYILELYCLYYD